jgi:LDH2 family malate/lactate/ureidoglycolate dehydrogenase
VVRDLSGIDEKQKQPKPMPLGHFFLAIDIEALCPLETFKETAIYSVRFGK